MLMYYRLYAIILYAVIPILVGMAVMVWRKKHAPGASALVVYIAGNLWWTLCYAFYLSHLSQQLPTSDFWLRLMFVGVVTIPPAFLIFSFQYTNRTTWVSRRTVALLLIEPILLNLSIWTDSIHGLFTGDPTWVSSRVFIGGTAFWLHVVYCYIMITISLGLLFWHAVISRAVFRIQSLLILLSLNIPAIANIVYVFKLGPWPTLDFTPLGLAISGIILAFAVFRRKLFDLIPVARDAIVEEMTDGLLVIDLETRIVDINPAAKIILGINIPSVLGMPGDKVISFWQRISSCLATDTDFAEEIFLDEKVPLYLNVRIRPLRDFRGQKIGWFFMIQDITGHKQAEEEKRRLEERLQHADKMESIGTLAGGIAHDFNNLLMGIQGYASLMLMTLDSSDPNRERIKRIEDQVQSGAELTRQLLGFARGGRYEVKPTDMNDIIEKTSFMFGRTKKEITINKKYENDLFPVEVDRGQMEQVFMNLYVNAWQAMPAGGNLYLETHNIFLNDEQALASSVEPGLYVKISITDTGTGMDEKTKERIFDPFFTTKAMGRGTGLGLATVYGIIKGHKGLINVYSEPGHGTTFSIYLPSLDKGVEVVKEEVATAKVVRGTETILLVDDEKMVLEVNSEMLESMGYQIYAVGSGQEAITIYTDKQNEIDLVILDMIMPVMSGGETFDRLRKINPEIKVLLSSGYSLNGEARTFMDRGCNGFLQKPFQIAKLSQKVRELLD